MAFIKLSSIILVSLSLKIKNSFPSLFLEIFHWFYFSFLEKGKAGFKMWKYLLRRDDER